MGRKRTFAVRRTQRRAAPVGVVMAASPRPAGHTHYSQASNSDMRKRTTLLAIRNQAMRTPPDSRPGALGGGLEYATCVPVAGKVSAGRDFGGGLRSGTYKSSSGVNSARALERTSGPLLSVNVLGNRLEWRRLSGQAHGSLCGRRPGSSDRLAASTRRLAQASSSGGGALKCG